jgi:N-acetyltransferase 10
LAGAIGVGYSNIFVTAPSPENLKTLFEFVLNGLKALKYVEHLDFEVIQEHHGEYGKVVVRVNIFRNHRQTIQYIQPTDHLKLSQAELVAIDEAAAIPLPTVKKLMGPYLVFLSSTINGYEGTGRSLSLKLIQQLRTQQSASSTAAGYQTGNAVAGSKSNKGARHLHEDRWKVAADAAASFNTSGISSGSGFRSLVEITLKIPIRYSSKDPVEKWLNNLLCLDVAEHSTRMVIYYYYYYCCCFFCL